MKKILYQEFTIHPVGQGLFYSGKITFKNEVKFRMVFDCGSKSAVAGQEEVKIYRNKQYLEEKQIDLLVISHFDADHVNQIGNLLAGGVIIKKLVMPFLTFAERLFLILRLTRDSDKIAEEDFVLRFILDPSGTINDNLDDDSEIFLIEGNPDGPLNPDETGEASGESDKGDFQKKFAFDFNKKEEIGTEKDIFKTSSQRKIFKVEDSEKGVVHSSVLKLMDFLFYKRKIQINEKQFYDEVERLFYETYEVNPALPENELFDAIVEAVKKIKSGPKIRKIFDDAQKTVGISGIKLIDLNTTALCMLHRNLPGILKLTEYPTNDLRYVNHVIEPELFTIHKFSLASRFEKFAIEPYYWYRRRTISQEKFIFPNTLLTSDSFLLKREQVDAFLKHYQNYWDDFWLFQIPHHGAENNSDDILHSHIRQVHNCFINYGIGNKDKHPSPSVIHDLIKTGNSSKLLPINQILGLRFVLSL